MTTAGLVPLADLPALLHRDPERIRWWVEQHIIPTIVVGGATYVPSPDVDRLRDPLVRCAAELDAAEAAPGCSILSAERLALVVRALSVGPT